jgi:hypothetical protein
MKKTAADLLLVAGSALAGDGVLQDSPLRGQTHYAEPYVLKELANHRVGPRDLAGTDRTVSAGTIVHGTGVCAGIAGWVSARDLPRGRTAATRDYEI